MDTRNIHIESECPDVIAYYYLDENDIWIVKPHKSCEFPSYSQEILNNIYKQGTNIPDGY